MDSANLLTKDAVWNRHTHQKQHNVSDYSGFQPRNSSFHGQHVKCVVTADKKIMSPNYVSSCASLSSNNSSDVRFSRYSSPKVSHRRALSYGPGQKKRFSLFKRTGSVDNPKQSGRYSEDQAFPSIELTECVPISRTPIKRTLGYIDNSQCGLRMPTDVNHSQRLCKFDLNELFYVKNSEASTTDHLTVKTIVPEKMSSLSSIIEQDNSPTSCPTVDDVKSTFVNNTDSVLTSSQVRSYNNSLTCDTKRTVVEKPFKPEILLLNDVEENSLLSLKDDTSESISSFLNTNPLNHCGNINNVEKFKPTFIQHFESSLRTNRATNANVEEKSYLSASSDFFHYCHLRECKRQQVEIKPFPCQATSTENVIALPVRHLQHQCNCNLVTVLQPDVLLSNHSKYSNINNSLVSGDTVDSMRSSSRMYLPKCNCCQCKTNWKVKKEVLSSDVARHSISGDMGSNEYEATRILVDGVLKARTANYCRPYAKEVLLRLPSPAEKDEDPEMFLGSKSNFSSIVSSHICGKQDHTSTQIQNAAYDSYKKQYLLHETSFNTSTTTTQMLLNRSPLARIESFHSDDFNYCQLTNTCKDHVSTSDSLSPVSAGTPDVPCFAYLLSSGCKMSSKVKLFVRNNTAVKAHSMTTIDIQHKERLQSST